uniref:Uncharacterized protein n=1 Tax=Glossina austeni TaxID=7395 RepID=A0A1A9V3S3_GLOAU
MKLTRLDGVGDAFEPLELPPEDRLEILIINPSRLEADVFTFDFTVVQFSLFIIFGCVCVSVIKSLLFPSGCVVNRRNIIHRRIPLTSTVRFIFTHHHHRVHDVWLILFGC